jgi:hypothetical protein
MPEDCCVSAAMSGGTSLCDGIGPRESEASEVYCNEEETVGFRVYSRCLQTGHCNIQKVWSTAAKSLSAVLEFCTGHEGVFRKSTLVPSQDSSCYFLSLITVGQFLWRLAVCWRTEGSQFESR